MLPLWSSQSSHWLWPSKSSSTSGSQLQLWSCARQRFCASSQTPRVQGGSDSTEQSRAPPPVQAPAWQLSATVQNIPSSHSVPLVRGLRSQASLASLQTPLLQLSLIVEQLRAAPVQA